ITPEFEVVKAHGRLSAEDMDRAMSAFAGGRGDVLLSTNIIENGLDVPRANTMVVWRPDRFGLAQLHQLRGRVGRGRRQGFAYLLSDPQSPIADSVQIRLQTMEALDRLGAGFAISARDLDLRGGGDLMGEDQAGHVRLIGANLYQRILASALRSAQGEAVIEATRPRLELETVGSIPETYVPDVDLRVNLYSRLSRLSTAQEIDAMQEEMEDRFGPLPDETSVLLAAHRLSALAVAAGVTNVLSGPKGTAFTFNPVRTRQLNEQTEWPQGHRWSKDRLIIETEASKPHDLAFMETTLEELSAA
ncbi:hypothetical protein LTR94_026169, partial [Friedmanniomyces endolithicus]